MSRYLIRRLLISLITLVAISMVVFLSLALAPGDPLSGFAGKSQRAARAARAAARADGPRGPDRRAIHPLGNPVPAGQLGDLVHDALGCVRDYVLDRLPVTLRDRRPRLRDQLMIAIPVGVISAIKQYSLFDQCRDDVRLPRVQHPDVLLRHPADLHLQRPARLAAVRLRQSRSKASGRTSSSRSCRSPCSALAGRGADRFVRASMLETIRPGLRAHRPGQGAAGAEGRRLSTPCATR